MAADFVRVAIVNAARLFFYTTGNAQVYNLEESKN
jgi:hypothetical protein